MAVNLHERRAWILRVQTATVVLASVVLALAAALLVTWLAERPGLRLRHDVTAGRQSSLDPAALAVLANLPEPVTIDVFFRPGEPPLARLIEDVHARTEKLLVLLRDARAGWVEIVEHDVGNRAAGSAVENRMRELGLTTLETGGLLVVSSGQRRVLLRVRGDISDIDPGNLDVRQGPIQPPRVLLFRGEEALVSALLKVSQGRAAKILFSTGHGERELAKTDMRGLERLKHALEGDGFVIEVHAGEGSGAIPADTAVFALLGPEQPLTAAEVERISAFVRSGGRLIAAPGFNALVGPGSLAELLTPFGFAPEMNGLIARPLASATGQPLYGVPQCGETIVWGDEMRAHPITDSLRRSNLRVHLPFSRSIARTGTLAANHLAGTVLDLLTSGEDAWRDLPDPSDPQLHDWTPGAHEQKVKGTRPFVLAMVASFAPSLPVPPERAALGDMRPEGRVLCLGSADVFANELADTNRDFVLNAFNWAASREYRVNVRPNAAQVRRIDTTSGSALATITFLAAWLLPGAALLLGVVTAWWRRRR